MITDCEDKQLKQDYGYVRSWDYPGEKYAHGLNCKWIIEVPVGKRVVLFFDKYNFNVSIISIDVSHLALKMNLLHTI